MPKRVLALDPGDRVGWARADVHEDGTWENLKHGITPLRDMAIAVHSSLATTGSRRDPKYDIVVVEDWRLRPGEERNFIGSSFPSVQFIGMVKLCCWLSGTTYVTQQPSDKKIALKSMANLRPDTHEMVTTPRKHDDAHDMDALMHLWFYTFKNCEVRP